jgi:hypothetical protein
MNIILTVADHEQNGFVALAAWNDLPEPQARALISAIDGSISDEAEPDSKTASFTFILDLMNGDEDLLDTGSRFLPTQLAMAIAPDQVRGWLNARPVPDSVFHRRPPILSIAALSICFPSDTLSNPTTARRLHHVD